MKEKYPEDELWLLMGADMFLTLHTWHEPERILSLAGGAAFGREAQLLRAVVKQSGPPGLLRVRPPIEPTRVFPGVEALRRTCYEDLDAGLLLGLEMSIESLEKRGVAVNSYSVQARDYLKGKQST